MVELTDRDREILESLSRKVRVLSEEQIATAWWTETPTGRANVRRRIRKLKSEGWINTDSLPLKTLDTLDRPLFRWTPGQIQPDFGKIAWQLQRRWNLPTQSTTIVFATRFCAQQFGGKSLGRPKKPLQLSHDLGVAQVYVHYLINDPDSAKDWQGEDRFTASRKGAVLPDAMLIDQKNEPYLAIEFGGAYDKKRVAAWHIDCEDRDLPYELW